jgi:hypothetical protein
MTLSTDKSVPPNKKLPGQKKEPVQKALETKRKERTRTMSDRIQEVP